MSSLKREFTFFTYLIITGRMKSFSGLHKLKTRIHASGPECKLHGSQCLPKRLCSLSSDCSQFAAKPCFWNRSPLTFSSLHIQNIIQITESLFLRPLQLLMWEHPSHPGTVKQGRPAAKNRWNIAACRVHAALPALVPIGKASQDADPVGYCWPAGFRDKLFVSFCWALHP